MTVKEAIQDCYWWLLELGRSAKHWHKDFKQGYKPGEYPPEAKDLEEFIEAVEPVEASEAEVEK